MPIVPKQLVAPVQVAAAATDYIAAVTVKTRLDKVTVTNPTTTARSITFYIIPSGGAAGDSTTITKEYAIPAKSTWNCPDLVGQILSPASGGAAGDKLQALASAATALTLMISGTEIS